MEQLDTVVFIKLLGKINTKPEEAVTFLVLRPLMAALAPPPGVLTVAR